MAKGVAAGLPFALFIGELSPDWPLGVTFVAIAVVGGFAGTVMMRSADAAERRDRRRD
ncbi:MAG TPA: hypothetical protein VF533_08355 [Solirubrobacteraceae bacterium]